jgi:apolipoprotein D and lipocalin family protein
MKNLFLVFAALSSFLLLNGCSGIKSTDSLPPVTNFDSSRYLGVWYEIVRLPNFFEKDLSNITATYSLRDDGGINVLNKGLNFNSGKWEEAKGRAYFVKDSHTGLLKVTFFWPFYGEYRIIQLDPEYQWAVVTSGTMDYFWILSRTPQMSTTQIEKLVRQAAINGFMTSKFIYVKNDVTGTSPAVK